MSEGKRKDTRRRFVTFSFYDRTGIEAYLEKQAAKGWLLEKMSALGWVFRRTEPRRIHFAVTYFPKASVFDPEPSEEQRSFQDFCAHTGWQLASANAQMQVFYNELENPVPIETDAALEVETIHKAAKRLFLPNYLLILLLDLLEIALFGWRLVQDPIGVLSSKANLFSGFFWVMGLLLILVELGGYWRWYRRAGAAAELDGSFVPTRGYRGFKLLWLGFLLAAFVFMMGTLGRTMALIGLLTVAVIFAITAVIVSVSELLKRRKVAAEVNRRVTVMLTVVMSLGLTGILLIYIVSGIHSMRWAREPVDTYEMNGYTFRIYADALPLTVEDMVAVAYDGYSYELRSDESPLLGRYDAVQRPRIDGPDVPELEYTVTDVKLPVLYELCRDAMLTDITDNYGLAEGDALWRAYTVVDAAPWGAAAAYQVTLGGEPMERYLLCYADSIVEIRFDWAVTPEQKAIVGVKLGGI